MAPCSKGPRHEATTRFMPDRQHVLGSSTVAANGLELDACTIKRFVLGRLGVGTGSGLYKAFKRYISTYPPQHPSQGTVKCHTAVLFWSSQRLPQFE